MIELDCPIRGVPHKIRAVRTDKFFGHAIDVQVLTADGVLLDKMFFACHPEYDEYDRFQSMSTEELLEEIIKRLQSGRYDSMLEDSRKSGPGLMLRLNSPDAKAPNRAHDKSG